MHVAVSLTLSEQVEEHHTCRKGGSLSRSEISQLTVQVLDFPLLVNDGGASLKSDLGVRRNAVALEFWSMVQYFSTSTERH